MREEDVRRVLEEVAAGKTSVDSALESLQAGPFARHATQFVTPDLHRQMRTGFCEVIYAPGKTAPQIVDIARLLSHHGTPALITRLTPEQALAVRDAFSDVRTNQTARTVTVRPPAERSRDEDEGYVAVVSAGTADLPVAEEAVETCMAMDIPVESAYDVGVAGLHRLVEQLPLVRQADVIVAVAGMDGALASVIGGLVSPPVIGVPTSTGYGASFEGLAALLTMLNSCAPGVTVTNIDAGFSAAMAAAKIVRAKRAQRASAV